MNYRIAGKQAGGEQGINDSMITGVRSAEDIDLAKSNFLARMSHEMRTPLNAIIGMTTIARSTEDSGRIARCLFKIEEASNHLLRMINDILDMSKIETGKFEISRGEVVLDEMIKRIIPSMKFSLEEKKLSFTKYLDPALPKKIISDEQRLSQIITNLLSNAVKFSLPEGKISLEIQKIVRQSGNEELRIQVRDTGIGISTEQKENLFSLFEQGEGGFDRKHGGAGLGLTLTKNIVDLMGGRINVESEPGKGSIFIVDLALEEGKPFQNPLDKGCSFTDQNILLAEDVELNRDIFMSLLEPTGLTIDCAENGSQAVKMFEEEPGKYSIIFIDIHMPEMDGYEATRRIRAIEGELKKNAPMQKRIPIIAMTANVFREDVKKCLDEGMDGHLGKPLEIEEIMKYLKLYLK